MRLRNAPCNHQQLPSNSLHQRLNQSFPKNTGSLQPFISQQNTAVSLNAIGKDTSVIAGRTTSGIVTQAADGSAAIQTRSLLGPSSARLLFNYIAEIDIAELDKRIFTDKQGIPTPTIIDDSSFINSFSILIQPTQLDLQAKDTTSTDNMATVTSEFPPLLQL